MLDYLKNVNKICTQILGKDLVGLYAQGSLAFHDFRDGLSDFDLLGVVREPLTPLRARQLAEALDHSRLPVPAEGMEMVLVTERTAAHLRPVPRYEMWMYTGETWRSELELGGQESELLIFFSILLQCGKTLSGPNPETLFQVPPREWVLNAMREVLEFHLEKLGDPFWDPKGRNTVLNACRTWRYSVVGSFSSKARGGQWVLEREHWPVVVDALGNREVKREEAIRLVERILREMRPASKAS